MRGIGREHPGHRIPHVAREGEARTTRLARHALGREEGSQEVGIVEDLRRREQVRGRRIVRGGHSEGHPVIGHDPNRGLPAGDARHDAMAPALEPEPRPEARPDTPLPRIAGQHLGVVDEDGQRALHGDDRLAIGREIEERLDVKDAAVGRARGAERAPGAIDREHARRRLAQRIAREHRRPRPRSFGLEMPPMIARREVPERPRHPCLLGTSIAPRRGLEHAGSRLRRLRSILRLRGILGVLRVLRRIAGALRVLGEGLRLLGPTAVAKAVEAPPLDQLPRARQPIWPG